VTVNVVTEKEVENIKPRKAEEVLQRILGVNSSDLGSDFTITSIRIPTHFTNPYTLVLVDGIPTENYGSGSGSFSDININNIARIEVVKGPGSALCGSNAIGGIINVITEDPGAEPQLRLWTELGGYERWRSGIHGSTSGEKFGVNVHLNYNNSDNWREHSSFRRTNNSDSLQAWLNLPQPEDPDFGMVSMNSAEITDLSWKIRQFRSMVKALP
jgi:outer membrane cobalamin receptor